jgi:hypothetical protein
MDSETAGMLINVVRVQARAEDIRLEASETTFQHASDLRALVQKWDSSGPHAPTDIKEVRERSEDSRASFQEAIVLIRTYNKMRSERNARLVALAKEVESHGQDASQLLVEMLDSYRHDLEVDLPPIVAKMDEGIRQASELQVFVESHLRTPGEGRLSKFFGQKK